MKLLAFNNDANLKADLIIELKKHRKADAIIRGSYGEFAERKFRGCAVGCSINSYNVIKGLHLNTSLHRNYEKFGIPKLLARLEDGIFESLPTTHNLDWPINFMSAINVGSDLSVVWAKFAQWLMTDKKYGVLQYAKTNEQKIIIQKVSDLYKNGGSRSDFKSSADAAAAAYSAYAATAAAAAYSAAAAAYDSADAAANAAYASADAADAADATNDAKRFEVRIAQSKYLIKLLKECK